MSEWARMIHDARSHSFQNSSPNRDDFNFFKGAPARWFQFQSRAIVTISIPSMALNLDNNFKVSARKQHELPGNQRVLSQRIGHKQYPRARPPNLETIPGSSTMIVDSGASIPRAIADDQFLEQSMTTIPQRLIWNAMKSSTTSAQAAYQILQHSRDPIYIRVLPSKEQRVLDLLAQQTQPIKYKRTSTPKANMRVNTHDINNHRHQPTARRPTWADERVPGPVLNLKIDGDQWFQTNTEIWAQSEATEINSLNPSSAISPIYDGPVQSERN